jgi:outer membrane protein OmpA-like peptidoglycan-associated protein
VSAAVGCGALLIGMATAEPAQAAGPRAAVPQPAATPSVLPAQLPAWYHTPLTAAQIRSEVAIPRRPARVKGNVRLTKADYTNAHGALAVDATQAAGHVLIAGESLQLSGAGLFGYGSSTLTSGARAELARLRDAFTYVTSVECEGYTDYAATGKTADVTLGAARANAVCLALMGDDQGLSSTSATGLGEARPAVVGGQRHAQRAANRRVVVDITSSTVGAPKTPTVTVSSAFNQAAVLDLVPAAVRSRTST